MALKYSSKNSGGFHEFFERFFEQFLWVDERSLKRMAQNIKLKIHCTWEQLNLKSQPKTFILIKTRIQNAFRSTFRALSNILDRTFSRNSNGFDLVFENLQTSILLRCSFEKLKSHFPISKNFAKCFKKTLFNC